MFGNLSVNQVLRNTVSEKEYRILYISDDRKTGFWIELDPNGGMPDQCDIEEIDALLMAGKMTQVKDTWLPPRTASEKSRNQRDALWQHLRECLEREPAIFEKNNRKALLEKASGDCGIAVPNLYPKLKRFWRYGKVKDAFLYADENKGGKGKTRLLKKNSGRKPTESAICSKVLTEDDLGLFEKYVMKHYLNRQENLTLKEVYNLLIREQYSDIVRDEHGAEQVISRGMNQAPTFRQFQYWHSKFKKDNGNQETAARKGQSEFNLKERAVTGKADFGILGPGSQYQIDATVADVYLVSQFNRRNIIGRPIVYFVVDTFSRMVTGMYIGLEGPSWMGMAMALYNAFTDKVNYCRGYGIEITENMWPCHHLPQSLLGDRGELEGHNGARLAEKLNIRVDNTPPYRGDLKPIVERYFKISNDAVIHRLPASVRPELAHRGGHDYRLDARLDLRQFTRIMIFSVLTYNKTTLKSFEPSEAMMKAGVELTPLELWNWGINCSAGILRTADEERCRYALLPEDTCDITERGIKFRKLFYSCSRAVKEQWFENARRNGAYKMKVSYDPRDMHAVYVWKDGERKPELAALVDWEQKFDGKSCEECEYEMEVISQQKTKNAKRDHDAGLTLDKFVEGVAAEAAAMAPDTADIPKSERTAGINASRQKEKEAMRCQESFIKDDADSSSGADQESPRESSAGNEEKSSNLRSSLFGYDDNDTRGMRKMTELEKQLWGMSDE